MGDDPGPPGAARTDDLPRRVARWVEAGVIRPDQADAILAIEGGAADRPERRTAVAEVLGYVGGTLAVVAAVAIGAKSWVLLGRGARLAVLAIVTAALFAAGRWLRGRGRGLDRLAGVLWMASVAGWAGLLGVLGGRHAPLLVAAGATAYAALLWAVADRREHALPQVAMFLAAMATVAAAADEVAASTGWVAGPGLLALGVAWLELARRGLVRPRRTAEALGALAMVAGAETLHWNGSAAAGLALGLVVAVALVVAGSVLGRTVPLGFGAAALFLTVTELAGQYWRSLGAPVAILLAGLGLLAAAVVVARLGPAAREP